ncbi:MAG: hypothetical protein WDZ79_02090, partial [Candidatus Paceibacterota bacterium]
MFIIAAHWARIPLVGRFKLIELRIIDILLVQGIVCLVMERGSAVDLLDRRCVEAVLTSLAVRAHGGVFTSQETPPEAPALLWRA